MKQYVNRNQAEKLKALGYHEPCNWYYVIESKEGEDIPDGKLKSPVMEFDYNKNRRTVSCPDVDDVCNWFVENYSIFIFVRRTLDEYKRYFQVFIQDKNGKNTNALKSNENPEHSKTTFKLLHKAKLTGIDKAIEWVTEINNQI